MPFNPNTPGSTSQADNAGTNPSSPFVLLASAARTVTDNSGATGFDTAGNSALALELNVTAVSGTTPSVTLSLEWSNDNAAWAPADPVDTFTATTTVSRKVKNFSVKGRYVRTVWTISGTTPSLTFVVNAVGIN